MDFTFRQYSQLLIGLKKAGYSFQTFEAYIQNPLPKAVILRHDVDRLPGNALTFARLENSLGIKGSYYFRIVPESFSDKIIPGIASLGHEIGYHYETMDSASHTFRAQRFKTPGPKHGTINDEPGIQADSILDAAFEEFCLNLGIFRRMVTVKTICMHGSPRSRYDNRDIWKKYNYRGLGIIGEPYFDIDFSNTAYYTDTGRMWDGDKYSVRDKISSTGNNSYINPLPSPPSLGGANKAPFPKYHKTKDIIDALHNNTFPSRAMLTFHPQRWADKPLPWAKEWVSQNIKNVVKRWFFMQKNAI